MIISLIVLVLSINVSAQIREQVCATENPTQELLKEYRIEGLAKRFSEVSSHFEAYPLANKEKVKASLDKSLASYEEQVETIYLFDNMIGKLSHQQKEQLGEILNGFMRSFDEGKERVEEELTYSDDPQKYSSLRPEKMTKMYSGLLGEYKPRLDSLLNEVEGLAQRDVELLQRWTFQLFSVKGPQYQWTSQAARLDKYLSEINQNHLLMKTRGNLVEGFYVMNPQFIREFPGLTINVIVQSRQDMNRDININLSYSPFREGLEVQVCNSFSAQGQCSPVAIEQWCAN